MDVSISSPSEEHLIELEYVFLRLSKASNRAELETFVVKNIPVLFHHLASDYEVVRSKVVEIFTQLHKRLKNNPDVLLPFVDLFDFYNDHKSSSFVKNFSFLFLKLAFPRLSVKEQFGFIPSIMKNILKKSETEQLNLYSMLVPGFVRLAELTDKESEAVSIEPNSLVYADWEKLIDFLSQILQLPYREKPREMNPMVRNLLSQVSRPNQLAQPPQAPEPMDVDEDDVTNINLNEPADRPIYSNISSRIPGVCKYTYDYLCNDSFTKDFFANPSYLEAAKLGVIRFLSKLPADFVNKTGWLMIVSSADAKNTVIDSAEREFKKIDDPDVKESLNSLFLTFLGTMNSKTIPIDRRKNGADLRLKLKILTFLLKSEKSASSFPHNIQVIFDGIFGESSNLRLKQLAIDFARRVAGCLSGKTASVFGPVLFDACKKVVDENDDEKVLCSAYRLMGELGKICASTIVKDMENIHNLFEELTQQNENVSSAIHDCLISWSDLFLSNDDSVNAKLLEALIFANMENKSSKIRFVALKYLEKIGSSKKIETCFALFIACGDNDDFMRKESELILRSFEVNRAKDATANELPSFDEAVDYCVRTIKSKKNLNEQNRFQVKSMKEMIRYLNFCMEASFGFSHFHPELNDHVKKLVAEKGSLESCAIFEYFKLVLDLVVKYTVTEPIFLNVLHDLAISCESFFPSYLSDKLPFLENLAYSTINPELCHCICNLHGFVFMQTAGCDTNSFKEKFEKLFEKSKETHDLILGRCLLLSYISLYAGNELRQTFNTEFVAVQKVFINRLNDSEKSFNNLFVSCSSLGVILKNSAIVTNYEKTTELVKFLLTLIESRKEYIKISLKKEALFVLSSIVVCIADSDLFDTFLDGLTKTGEVPTDLELHLSIGEAFVISCTGSREKENKTTKNVMRVSEEMTIELINKLLHKFSSLATVDNRHIKQALCNWLYVLLDRLGEHQTIRQKLVDLQSLVLLCLAENNEFTQDTSCRCLALIFRLASSEQKDGLIISLLEKLNATNAKESLLPYQELCLLSTSIGNRQTIYDFMLMAVSRKINLNESKLIRSSYESLAVYFDKIVPVIYRATYDPSPKVQATMKIIWATLQSEFKDNMLQKYSLCIVKNLLTNLTNPSWRVREACCLALSDFMKSQYGNIIADYLGELWVDLFRLCDDIKESVRIAAARSILVLQRVTIKFCCPHPNTVNSKALDSVLPILLKGIESPVKEVNALSLVTLSSLSREAGARLKPHLHVLITALLESLSTMEPEAVNYFSVRAGTEQEAETVLSIDQARVTASKTSPMMDAVEYCTRFIDADVLTTLVPNITRLLQSSIGLATKTGCFRFINLLCGQCPNEIRQFADVLLRNVTSNGIVDRNVTIRKHAAATVGYLVKFSSEAALNKLFSKIETWYLDHDSDVYQSTCAYLLRAIANEDLELLKTYGSSVAPIVCMAVNGMKKVDIDASNSLNPIWDEIWNEFGGTDVTTRLYLEDIIKFCMRVFFDSLNWNVKARSLLTLSFVVSKHCGSLSEEKLNDLLNALFASLQGRTWEGKENILITLSSLFEQASVRLDGLLDSNKKAELFAILLRESKKTNVVYRTAAVRCAATFCKCFNFVDGCGELFSLLLPLLRKERQLSEEEEISQKAVLEQTDFYTTSYSALSDICCMCDESQKEFVKSFVELCQNEMVKSTWKVQLTVLDVLLKIIKTNQDCFDVKSLTYQLTNVFENASQNLLKEACLELLRITLMLLLSKQEKVDAQKLKSVICSDDFCKTIYPDVITTIDALSNI